MFGNIAAFVRKGDCRWLGLEIKNRCDFFSWTLENNLSSLGARIPLSTCLVWLGRVIRTLLDGGERLSVLDVGGWLLSRQHITSDFFTRFWINNRTLYLVIFARLASWYSFPRFMPSSVIQNHEKVIKDESRTVRDIHLNSSETNAVLYFSYSNIYKFNLSVFTYYAISLWV